MAGGQGRRLFPASRPDRPKQFLAPGDGPSLLRRTADRAGFADEIYAVTPPAYTQAVEETVPEAALLVEPEPRDTGPALVYAAHRLQDRFPDCRLVCLPTDHHVSGEPGPTYQEAAAIAGETGGLVTVGIEPDRPATGYGYIEPGASICDGRAREALSFQEKPDAERATEFVAAGYLWNTGVFAWEPSALLEAARGTALGSFVDRLDADSAPEQAFQEAPSVSIDEAVVEEAERLAVVPASHGWDDVGSWDAIGRVFGTDLADRSLRLDTERTILASDGPHITAIEVEDLVVVAYDDHVLVVPRESAQRVREAAEHIDG
jgi:mannose-1-phosphate guanylyltransferase